MNRRSFIASVVAALTVGCAAKPIEIAEVALPVEEPLLLPVPVSIWAFKTDLIHDAAFHGNITVYSKDKGDSATLRTDESGVVQLWITPGKYTIWANDAHNNILKAVDWTVRPEVKWQSISLLVE